MWEPSQGSDNDKLTRISFHRILPCVSSRYKHRGLPRGLHPLLLSSIAERKTLILAQGGVSDEMYVSIGRS